MSSVMITNPGFDPYLTTGETYHQAGEDYYKEADGYYMDLHEEMCADREANIALATVAGITAVLYNNKYGDAVDKRDDINNRLLNCLTTLHNHWCDHTYEYQVYAIHEAIALGEITLDRSAELAFTQETSLDLLNASNDYLDHMASRHCYTLPACERELEAAQIEASISSANMLIRNGERRMEERKDLKAAMLAEMNNNGYRATAPAIQAYASAGQLANAAAAQYSVALNSSLSTLGSALA